MAKFCGKCGSMLNENGMCPNCDVQPILETERTMAANEAYQQIPQETPQEIPQEMPQEIPQYQAQPVEPAAWQPQDVPAPVSEPKPKKKLSKKTLIIIIAAAVVVIGILVACAFIFHWFGLGRSSGDGEITTQTQAFVRTSYGKVWNGINIDEVTDSEQDPDDCTVIDNNGDKVRLYNNYAAKVGDTFYGRNGDKMGLFKITFTGETSADTEEWVNEDQLKDSVLGYGDYFVRDLGGFAEDGDYIYGYVVGSNDFFSSHLELNYRMFRIPKSGGDIEFVGDEDTRAAEFILYDGWIYFVDNGYKLDGKSIEFDSDRVGIYRMKTDGSDKTELFSGDVDSENEKLGCAGGLTIADDKLYFLAITDDGSLLHRMDLDGSDDERLCIASMERFTIDTDHDVVYFLGGKYRQTNPDGSNLFKLDLGSKDVTTVKDRIVKLSTDEMTYDDGYIYLVNEMKASTDGTGYRRFNIDSGEVEQLKIVREMEVTYDEMGVADRKITQTICWQPKEDSDTI